MKISLKDLLDDPEVDIVSKKIFGTSASEALAKQICISCKEAIVNATEREKLSYDLDALCPKCSIKAATPSSDPLLRQAQEAMEPVRELLLNPQFFEQQDQASAIDVKLTKLSICSCGYQMLKDEIRLGTPYKIWVGEVVELSFYCGGCMKTRHKVACVLANQYLDKKKHPAPLPLELFDNAGN